MNDFDEIVMPSSSHLVSYNDKTSLKDLFSFTQLKNESVRIREYTRGLKNEFSHNSSALIERTRKVLEKFSSLSRTLMLPYSSYILTSSIDRYCQFLIEKSRNFGSINKPSQLCYYDNFPGKQEPALDVCIDPNNLVDMEYASNLCSLNRLLVRPLLDQNPYVQTSFARFFSVSYDYGKSIHDTSNILTVASHSAVVQYASASLQPQQKGAFFETLKILPQQICSSKSGCGYVAQFGQAPRIYLEGARKILKISDISFDMQFFNAVSLLSKTMSSL